MTPSRSRTLDLTACAGLVLATFVVHDVGYVLSKPFWNDENWVAVSTRLPLRDLLKVTGSTPAGWTLLLRLVPLRGEHLRLVPLLFSVATVIAAFVLVRSLPWRSPRQAQLAATLAGAAVLLTPSMLIRNDLKQYTTDTLVTMLVLHRLARLETSWSRRGLVALGATCLIGFLFSAVALFVGVAAFGTLLLVSWRQRSRVLETCVVGGVTGLGLGLVFLVLYVPGLNPALSSFWNAYYLPLHNGWGPFWRFLDAGTKSMASSTGKGPRLVLALLVGLGTWALVRLHRPGLALVVPLLLTEMLFLGALRKYPLFDARTSTFLTVCLAVLAAIGVADVINRITRDHGMLLVLSSLVVIATVASHVSKDIRIPTIAAEDLRTPTAYLASHRDPRDVVVVSAAGSWGLGVYWPRARPAPAPDSHNAVGFVVVFPTDPRIVVARDRTDAAVATAVDEAVALADADPGSRIWVLHDHTPAFEQRAFDLALKARGFAADPVVQRRGDLRGTTVATLFLLTRR